MKIGLIQLPTLALKLRGYLDSAIFLNNVYAKVMPASLLRVASVIKKELREEVTILDLRMLDPKRKEFYKSFNWEGYVIECYRVGASFEKADELIISSDVIGISSHFSFESGIVKDFIEYAKKKNPKIKIMIGGADVKARPQEYVGFGADLVFVEDFNPEEFRNATFTKQIGMYYRHPLGKLSEPSFELLPKLKEYSDSHDGPVPAGVPFPIGFIYFTRGCPRNCDFCETRLSRYEPFDFETTVNMLNFYMKSGVKTLNIVDDNLLILAAGETGRKKIIALFEKTLKMGFSWEFPNGLEVGQLARTGELDLKLFNSLFCREKLSNNQLIGAYRLYFPIETFDERNKYLKLKQLDSQNKIIEALAEIQIPEIAFGVIIPPTANQKTFDTIKSEYLKIKDIVKSKSFGKTKARYGVFHLIPISTYRSMGTKYSIQSYPELWNFYTPAYDGQIFSAKELFDKRMEMAKEIDFQNYQTMIKGKYGYG